MVLNALKKTTHKGVKINSWQIVHRVKYRQIKRKKTTYYVAAKKNMFTEMRTCINYILNVTV